MASPARPCSRNHAPLSRSLALSAIYFNFHITVSTPALYAFPSVPIMDASWKAPEEVCSSLGFPGTASLGRASKSAATTTRVLPETLESSSRRERLRIHSHIFTCERTYEMNVGPHAAQVASRAAYPSRRTPEKSLLLPVRPLVSFCGMEC